MKMLWVLPLGLAALVAIQGCKRKEPEPIPGPKARLAMAVVYAQTVSTSARAPGIAWFQGSLEEGFARSAMPTNCLEYSASPPRRSELMRARKKLDLPASEIPQIMRPRHRLV